jgi:hypothetical protein
MTDEHEIVDMPNLDILHRHAAHGGSCMEILHDLQRRPDRLHLLFPKGKTRKARKKEKIDLKSGPDAFSGTDDHLRVGRNESNRMRAFDGLAIIRWSSMRWPSM